MVNFDIKDGRLIISPEVLTVQAFNSIWESDKGKGKPKACNMLVYVFHMCDLRDKNFLRDVPDSERDPLARANAFGNKDYKFNDADQKLIDSAMAWYGVLNKNAVMRLSVALDRKIDEVTDYYLANTIQTGQQMDDQTDSMAKIDKILKAKKAADDFANDQMKKQKVKGDMKPSPLQSGILDKR